MPSLSAGRNWCRCDQCTYAGHWCGQHQDPPDNSDNRLIGGLWWVENLLPELDEPGEFWYNHTSNKLYVYPNATNDDTTWTDNLRFSILENLVDLRNVSNVEISGIGFRDSAASFMSEWSAPSGGDWSLHRGGVVFLENTTDIVIRDSTFRRLDTNAIFSVVLALIYTYELSLKDDRSCFIACSSSLGKINNTSSSSIMM